MKYKIIIGLEFHVQLKTKTKMFCACSNNIENKKPNSLICPICLGHPGTLPVVNKEAMHMAMKASLALNCKINNFTKFDRKNYFYPDLPKGYQISQFDKPLAEHGYFDINFKASDGLAATLDNKKDIKRIGITRLHVEEDSAKSIHDQKTNSTLVDYNRGGSPLAEIVTEPHISSPQEAKTFAQELQLLMRYLDISDANMEKGELRCDANISLRPEKDLCFYPKTEVKNINSFKSLEKALAFEIKRQKILWKKGKAPKTQETRGFNDNTGETVSQRNKEGFADYRYFPEPDLPPLTYTNEMIEATGRELCELPQYKRQRFIDDYNFTPEEAKILTHTKKLANFTEKIISELEEWIKTLENRELKNKTWTSQKDKLTKLTAGWLINKLIHQLSEQKIDFSEMKVTAENFAKLITLIYENKVNSTNALKILEHMIKTGSDPSHVMVEQDMGQVDNDIEILEIIKTVIKSFPAQVKQFKDGKENILKFLVGQVMKGSKGKANPVKAENLLKKQLKK